MNIHTITTAQVIKTKSRLKGAGLLNKLDNDVLMRFIAAMEANDVSTLKRDDLVDIWHIVEFTKWLEANPQQIKYKKDNSRISLD